MAYEIGTASDYKDLLERLKDFISDSARVIGDHPNMDELVAIDSDVASGESSQVWTIDRWVDDRESGVTDAMEMIAHGPGSSAADAIYVGIQTYSGADYFNWKLSGFTGYNDGTPTEFPITEQPGATPGRWPRILLWNQPMQYWFVANGRRFIVVAKVSSVYEACYLGFALPYGIPTDAAYPLVVGGSATGINSHKYSNELDEHRAFVDPYADAGAICTSLTADHATQDPATLKVLVDGSWIKLKNRNNTVQTSGNNVWPYMNAMGANSSDPLVAWNYGYCYTFLKQNIDGTFPVFPLILCLSSPVKNIFGELQGCFAVPGGVGTTLSPEDEIDIDGDTYIAFKNTFHNSAEQFWALKKE